MAFTGVDPRDFSNLALFQPTYGSGHVERNDVPNGRTGTGGFTPLSIGSSIGQSVAIANGGGCYPGGWDSDIAHITSDRPQYGLDPATGQGAWRFGADTQSKSAFEYPNTFRTLNFIHQTGFFAIHFGINFDTLSSGSVIMGNSDGSGNRAGFKIVLTAGNKIQFQVWDGVKKVCDATSATLTIAAGTHNDVAISGNGPGATTAIRITPAGGSTNSTQSGGSFNASPVTTNDAYYELRYGALQDGGTSANNPLFGWITNPVIQSGTPTLDERTWYKDWRPASNPGIGFDTSLVRSLGNGDPDQISYLLYAYEPGSLSNLFQDTANPATFGTAVTTTGQSVGTLRNTSLQNLPTGQLARDARYLSSSNAAPVVAQHPTTNRYELSFSGTASTWNGLIISQGDLLEPPFVTGEFSLLMYAQSNVIGDGTDHGQQGSEFISGGGSGIVLWGPNSVRPSQLQVYFASGTTVVLNYTLPSNPTGYHVYGLRKLANAIYLYVDGALVTTATPSASVYMGTQYLGWDRDTSTTDAATTTRANTDGRIGSLRVWSADIGDVNMVQASAFVMKQIALQRPARSGSTFGMQELSFGMAG